MIHESVIIRGNVEIGEDVTIEPYAIITGPARIGDRAYIGAHSMIGGAPQHRGSYPAPTSAPMRFAGVEVGADSCVREYVTIHHGVITETRVGDGVLLMAGCHIAHDCQIRDGVTMGSFSILGGLTVIDERVTFGQGVVTHPFALIGEGAMVGLNSSVVRDVLPFQKVAGAPAKLLGSNRHKDASLPPDWDETALGVDVWERWSRSVAERYELRATWANLEV